MVLLYLKLMGLIYLLKPRNKKEGKMKVIIDRIENDYAVVELDINSFVNLPIVIIPDAKEGDVIDIRIDNEETKKRKEKINNLMNQVFED